MRFVRITENNQIELLRCGAELFPALVAAIDIAAQEVWLETYLFERDEAGLPIMEALIRAARRGVSVHVTLDWAGTGSAQAAALRRTFVSAGVQCRVFNPWFRRGISRNHRKIVVVDGQVAFLGGINIIDDLRADHDSSIRLPSPRWDIAARIRGPLVEELHRAVSAHWKLGASLRERITDRIRKFRRKTIHKLHTKPIVGALVVSDNFRNRRTIYRAYLQALAGARSSVVLANPYFAPGRKLRNALVNAASRGVEVTLLLGVGQYHLQDAVAQSYYPQLLAAGVRIFEYRKTQLHGKVAVVDEHWATFGSTNHDGLSLFVNHEANVLVFDPGFSRVLRSEIERALEDSTRVCAGEHVASPWYSRIWNHCAALLYRNALRILSSGNSVD
ncbi:MAG: phospholipase D-like domain-containing protein [Verrucomicrobiota bacterium]